MADIPFPIPRSTDPTRYYLRPGVTPPTLATPVAGSVSANSNVLPLENRRIHPEMNFRNRYAGGPFVLKMYYDLFWKNKLHIIRRSFDAENVLTPIENTVEIYNAGVKLPAARVTSIAQSGVTGITITDGELTTPFTLGLQESEVYTYVVTTFGPSNINALYTFTFSDGQTLTHAITGRRVVVLNLPYQLPLGEQWTWLTDIIEAADGSEQRNAIREVPRQTWNLSYLFGDEYLNTWAEVLLTEHTPDQIAIPIFLDELTLTSAASIGDTVLNVSSTGVKDFRVGGELILRPDNFLVYETGRITAVGANTITLETGLLQAFAVNTPVYPLQIGRIVPTMRQQLWQINARRMDVQFMSESNKSFSDATGFTIYRTRPVWEDLMLLDSLDYSRQINLGAYQFDSSTGAFYQSTIRKYPKIVLPFIYEFDTEAQYYRMRNFLHSLKGRQKSMWLSTEREDMEIGSDNVAGVTMVIRNIGYARHIFGQKSNRIDVKITYANGLYDYRRINSATETTSVLETLVLDTASSQALSAANVSRISFLIKVRLESDNITLSHVGGIRRGYVNIVVAEINE